MAKQSQEDKQSTLGIMKFPMSAIVYDLMEKPKNTRQDREALGLSVSDYQEFSEAIQKRCYSNKQGNLCKLKNAKTKKLKNLRYNIRKSGLTNSMIWKAQLSVIESELRKRQANFK